MTDTLPKIPHSSTPDQSRTILGRLVLKGELSGNEDLLIDGQFEGSIDLHDHCLTIGPNGQVKADIHAGLVIVSGSVKGNISVRHRVEIRKTGHVEGDLLGPGIAIEDGAYYKGSIEILRKENKALTVSASRGDQAHLPSAGPTTTVHS